jgi:hypothetical protein
MQSIYIWWYTVSLLKISDLNQIHDFNHDDPSAFWLSELCKVYLSFEVVLIRNQYDNHCKSCSSTLLSLLTDSNMRWINGNQSYFFVMNFLEMFSRLSKKSAKNDKGILIHNKQDRDCKKATPTAIFESYAFRIYDPLSKYS